MVIDTSMPKPCMLFFVLVCLFACFNFLNIFFNKNNSEGTNSSKMWGLMFAFFVYVTDGFLWYTCLEKGFRMLYTR